jgi:RNA polymerase sigma factor (sigma-70 family)
MRATGHDAHATARPERAEALLDRARAGDADAFRALTDPYRREIEVHCYRILGSAQDAEDLLQETLLAAWRGLDGFAGRSSLRAWLYRIATNRSLNALRDAGRRPREMPPPLDLPPGSPPAAGHDEPVWLEPSPDVLLERVPDAAPGPEARYEAREAIGLAFVTGLQHLPPTQRAVLVLRDVHGFRSAEVAEMLDTSEAAVTSALQRARASLEARLPARDRERAPLPRSARERDVVGRFADAFDTPTSTPSSRCSPRTRGSRCPRTPRGGRARSRSAPSCRPCRSAGRCAASASCRRARTASPPSPSTSATGGRRSRGRRGYSCSRSRATASRR